MNWTNTTQSNDTNVWYVNEIKQFPEIYDDLFVGISLNLLPKKIIFTGHELNLGFWAVTLTEPITTATLYESNTWAAETTPLPARPDLRTRFPGVAHAEHGAFNFAITLDPSKSEYRFDINIDFGEEHFWLASFHLVNRNASELKRVDINQLNQVYFLKQWQKVRESAAEIANTCSKIIDIYGAKTNPAIFALLGDALYKQKQVEPAIAAYRKAVELQPQESKYEMRLAQMLNQRPASEQPQDTPKGISLSTSGETALTIIVDMLYRSTPSYMYARELFQNELDAIYRRWDKEQETLGLSDFTGIIRIEPDFEDPNKLCFWGDGIGMTFDQVTNHLAKLVNSGNVGHTTGGVGEQSSPSNFGIGAKTSALPENTQGMVYRTLPFGEKQGIEFTLWKNPNTFLYEIKAWQNGKNVEHYRKIPMEEFAPAIQQRGSGASATLMGNTLDEDTYKKSEMLLSRQIGTEQVRRGINYFLNSRYYTIPATGLDVKVAERKEDGSLLWHNIVGQKAFLDRCAEQSGKIVLTAYGLQVAAYWWILSEDAKEEVGSFNALGHVGLLWKNELYYNPNESQRGQRLQLNGFGIHFGEEQVVIYLEPVEPDLVDSHPSRTKLMYKNRELNASDFGQRFTEKMPLELVEFQKRFFANSLSGDGMELIRNNLQALGVHTDAKMRKFAAAFLNRGKPKPEKKAQSDPANPPKPIDPDTFRSQLPSSIWRPFDAETTMYAAEWDNHGYVIKFNSEWPQYQKALDLIVAENHALYPNVVVNVLKQECESAIRFEYYKLSVELLFNSYAMVEYTDWTDRTVENQLLSPSGLSAILQTNTNLRANIKNALANKFAKAAKK